MTEKGYRGYVSSRPFGGQRVPQHVQNIVINDYCRKNNLNYLLSATEVAMPGMYLMLDQLMQQRSETAGVVFYSLFQLPEDYSFRKEVFAGMTDSNIELHFAVEALKVQGQEDIEVAEQIFVLRRVVQESDCSDTAERLHDSIESLLPRVETDG